MKKDDQAERLIGLTLGINPLFALISTIYLSVFKSRGLIEEIKTDRANLRFWLLLVISGVISVIFSVNKKTAIPCFFIPFVFIWLYVLGRWTIKDPARFVQDLIRGVTLLSLIAIIAKIFGLNWSIGGIRILNRFHSTGRGEILYVADNGLGLLFQVGVVGAAGGILIYWKEKKYIVENIIAFLLCSFGLVISGSRGAMVGSIVALIFLVVRNGIYAILGAGIMSGILYFFSGERFVSAFKFQEHETRFLVWKSSLNIIRDHPFFGVGPGNFGAVYEKYKPEIFIATNYEVTCAHSNYLNIFIGWGIIGGVVFWGWQLFVFIRAIINGLNPIQRVIIAILISFYVHVSINDLFAAYPGFLLGLLDHPSFKKPPTSEYVDPVKA